MIEPTIVMFYRQYLTYYIEQKQLAKRKVSR